MSRVIFTLDIPLKESEYHDDKTFVDITRFKDLLLKKHEDYATLCGADYKVFGRNGLYNDLHQGLKLLDDTHQHFHTICNFKFLVCDILANQYDEVFYFDLDVVPNTTENIFEHFDLSTGIVLKPSYSPHRDFLPFGDRTFRDYINAANSVPEVDSRSALVKYAFVRTLLMLDGYYEEPDIWNTGIIGINSTSVQQLNYFGGDFKEIVAEICGMRNEDVFFKKDITQYYGLNDGEGLLSYLTVSKGLRVHKMDDLWHHTYKEWNAGWLNEQAHMIHFINKRFEDAPHILS